MQTRHWAHYQSTQSIPPASASQHKLGNGWKSPFHMHQGNTLSQQDKNTSRLAFETVTRWSYYSKYNWPTRSPRLNTRSFQKVFTYIKAHIKSMFLFFSVLGFEKTMCCCEVHTKKMNSLHQRAGKFIVPDPSLPTEQKMSALGIWNLRQQLTYIEEIFMCKVLNNNPPNYLAQLCLIF